MPFQMLIISKYGVLRIIDVPFNAPYIIGCCISKKLNGCIKCIKSEYNKKLKFSILSLTCQILMHHVPDNSLDSAFEGTYREIGLCTRGKS